MAVFDQPTPVVLCFSNHDPTGSSGTQADIETAASLGCHCAAVITAIAVRDTRDYKDLACTDVTLLIEQARSVLEDMPVAAIKIGRCGSIANIEAIHSILTDYPDVPVVVDPVVQTGGLPQPGSDELYRAIRALLLPLATLAIPGSAEAQALAPEADNPGACAQEILETGCRHVLVGNSPRHGQATGNTLYGDHRAIRHYPWPNPPVSCHGSGAAMAAAIAAYLAHGLGILDAVEQGQKFTWHSLQQARRLGMGRYIPDRFHWIGKQRPVSTS